MFSLILVVHKAIDNKTIPFSNLIPIKTNTLSCARQRVYDVQKFPFSLFFFCLKHVVKYDK